LEGDASKTFRFKRILIKKEVVHVWYNSAAAVIQDHQGRVGASTPIPNEHPPPKPIAPLP
jgi:hypothetical protein